MAKKGRKRRRETAAQPRHEFKIDPFAALDAEALVSETPDEATTTNRSGPVEAKEELSPEDAALGAVFGAGNNPAGGTGRQRVVMHVERKGRRGKTVTIVDGFGPQNELERMSMLAALKRELGTGGMFVEDAIHLQGDQRRRAAAWLDQQGFRVGGDLPAPGK